MPLSHWKKISQEFEVPNPWWTYRKDIFQLASGKRGEYHFVHVHGSSMIIPLLPAGKMLLVNQYRYLGDRESLEFPCGSVKAGSTYEKTAEIELIEETGFRAGSMILAGEYNPYNGVTDELSRIYIASNLSPAHAPKDETEEFEYVRLSFDELEEHIAEGKIWDGMTLAAWALAAKRVRSISSVNSL